MSSRTYDPVPARRVAFLGLGVMGHPMAGHLARAGHRVTVYNRSPAKAVDWQALYGGERAATPAAASAGAEFVFACVGNGPMLEAVRVTRTGPSDWSRESLFETGMPALLHAPEPPRFIF